MAGLKSHEKVVFERLFDRGGYVLNFTNHTFAEFFREHGIDIENQKYRFNGDSKMKRLRAFWEIEPDDVVGIVIYQLPTLDRTSSLIIPIICSAVYVLTASINFFIASHKIFVPGVG